MGSRAERDVEKGYPKADFVANLRRLADAIEKEERFEIWIVGKRISVPVPAEFAFEHERSDDEKVEFRLRWERGRLDSSRVRSGE